VRSRDGILEVEFGEYPQQAVSKTLNAILENEFARASGSMKKTGKTYTTDSVEADSYRTDFKAYSHDELGYDVKKYVRIIAMLNDDPTVLSNEVSVKSGDAVWVEVQPIVWQIDEAKKIALSKKAIVAGIRFYKKRGEWNGDFSNTEMNMFLQNHLVKDIAMSSSFSRVSENVDNQRKTRLQKLNPDTTEYSQRRKMTDTETIQNWIEAGQSVLLRGPSGIGKTERLKSLYPDLIYMKLTNNMFPEKVVGSMNLQTGQSIPPDFAKQALLVCSTDEEKKLISQNVQNLYDLADEIYERSKTSSNKIVILLDELLNVKPAVQSLVYTLVLNKLVETGKGLKLPANTVVVATGNQKKYSTVAEDLAEPLEKRFDHILDMEPKVGEWIGEYAIPNEVHPAVISYIFSKYTQKGKSENISDIDYFYEEPDVGEKCLDKNGCNGRTNDPRGWVSISNTLYAFEKKLAAGKFVGIDVEKLLEISIGTKLREEWAREFYDFYNIPTLTPKQIVNVDYTQSDLPRDINERFAYVSALLLADENQVEACRNFIRKHCDPEYLQLYDISWMGTDEMRIEKIAELQAMSLLNDELNMTNEGVGKSI